MPDIITKIRSSDATITGGQAKEKLDALFLDSRFVYFTSVHLGYDLAKSLAEKFCYSLAGINLPNGFIPSSQPIHVLRIEVLPDEQFTESVITTALVYGNGIIIDIASVSDLLIILIDRQFCDENNIEYVEK